MKEMKTLTINGVAYTVADPDAAHIDDSKIGDGAWSSKNTVDKLCPSFTESGAAVACHPVEGYPLSVQTDGTAPKITRCGKNLLPYPYKETTLTRGGITFTDHGDGTITANGTATFDAWFAITDTYQSSAELGWCIESGCPAGGSADTYYIVNVVTGHRDVGSGYAFKYDNKHQRWQIVIKKGVTVNNLVFKPQIEVGRTITEYEPYYAEEFSVGEAIPAREGVNVLWADSGEITVTGKADPTAVIEKLTNAIIALGGNI